MKSLGRIGIFLIGILMPSSLAYGFNVYQSENFTLELKGYYKNLYFNSKSIPTDQSFNALINRVRTEWDTKIFKIFSTKIAWDNELINGDFVGTAEFNQRQVERNEPYLDMDYELVRQSDFFYGQQFYRAYAKIDPGSFSLTLGRQKIDWGVMRLISPGDLFTRLTIFNVEKDEKVGGTAGNLVVPIGPSLRIHTVYDFHPEFDESRIGGRLTKTIKKFDLSVLGGKFLQDQIFGFDFSGDLGKAGIRGEFFYDRSDIVSDFVQGAAGVDYGFENTFYFALEYFFNGEGTNNPTTALPFPAVGAQIRSVHENFISLLMKYDISPLWRASLTNVVDLNGGSVFINPETRYGFFHWLEVSIGGHIPVGRTGGEFTLVPNLFYFQTQLFF